MTYMHIELSYMFNNAMQKLKHNIGIALSNLQYLQCNLSEIPLI